MELLHIINGQNNEFTVVLPQGEVNCLMISGNGKIGEIVSRANISVIGNNNLTMRFDSEESAEEMLLGGGFLLVVKGDYYFESTKTTTLQWKN